MPADIPYPVAPRRPRLTFPAHPCHSLLLARPHSILIREHRLLPPRRHYLHTTLLAGYGHSQGQGEVADLRGMRFGAGGVEL